MLDFLVHRFISVNQRKRILNFLFHLFKINPLVFAYNKNGILNWENDVISGEEYILKVFLKKHIIKRGNNLVLFDVGANTGEYALKINENYPNSKIFSFEPFPQSYELALQKVKTFENIELYHLGFSSKIEEMNMYSKIENPNSQHATVFKNVLTDIHKRDENSILSSQVSFTTIDNFCSKNNIIKIDFIKIDTEGFEFEILKGAKNMLNEFKIDFIQFEFNEMNVVSRTFFKDFFDLFSNHGYKLYRIHEKKLEAVNRYNTFYEIFKFQNFIATYLDVNES